MLSSIPGSTPGPGTICKGGDLTGGATTSTAMDYSVFSSVISTISDSINVTGIISVLVGIIPVALAFVALWWGVRKAAQVLFSGFRSGRLNM